MLRATSGAFGNVAITGGTITGVTGVAYDIAKWALPFIAGPSGTMANNGAVTWGTALRKAYTGGAWVLMPAGSIAAGVPAAPAWLWYVGATTTTGTFFNSVYTTGIPVAGTATPFVTTGPGAFVATTVETAAVIIPVAGNLLGPNGLLIWDFHGACNNTAGVKSWRTRYSGFGGTAVYNAGGTTGNTATANIGFIQNQNNTGQQLAGNVQAIVVDVVSISDLTVDTAAASTLVWTVNRSVATDVQTIERGRVQAVFNA